MKFIKDNSNPADIIATLKARLVNAPQGTIETAKKAGIYAGEKLNPSIKLDTTAMREAKTNPYTAEYLNEIHNLTNGKIGEVTADYLPSAIKKIGNEQVQTALDAKIESYKE